MRKNGQYLKKYSGIDVSDVQAKICVDWETVYTDCKIVSISINHDHGLFHGLVVYEEVSK